MKHACLLALCLVPLSAIATDVGAEAARWQQQEIDLAIAPIKSLADLEHHLTTAIDSPLAKLTPDARKEFIESLVFTSKGLGSYSWRPLAATLSVTDTWRVLSLFGLQSTTSDVPGPAATSDVEHHMLEAAPMIQHDWGNKICVVQSPNVWCETQYGANCSRACD